MTEEKNIKNIFIREADYGDYKEIYLTIHPENVGIENLPSDFQDQSKNCLSQLRNYFDENNLSALNILSIVSLLRVENDDEYQDRCSIFEKK